MTLPALATAILIAAAIALVAYRAGALTRGGSMAAVGIGALSVAAGWS